MPISGQTQLFTIYVMFTQRERERADHLTIYYRKKQIAWKTYAKFLKRNPREHLGEVH